MDMSGCLPDFFPPPVMLSSEDRLIALLRPFLRLLPADAGLPMDADLGKLGLDSLQSIELLMALEQEFGVTIPDEKITVDAFATPANVLALVS
jgi:acyl carrier protein